MKLAAIFRPACWAFGHHWRAGLLAGEGTRLSPAVLGATCMLCRRYVCCSTDNAGLSWFVLRTNQRSTLIEAVVDARLVKQLRLELKYQQLVWSKLR